MFALPSLLLLSSSVARASEKLFVLLDYQTDATLEGCPGEATFRAMVSDQLGYDPFRSDAPLKVVARTHPDAGGIRGSIEWYDGAGNPRGKRELLSPDAPCTAHVRALSFAVAVQIQLLAREAEDAASGTQRAKPADTAPAPRESPRASSAALTRDAERPDSSRAEARAGWRFALGAGPFATLGSSPQAAPGARLFAAARRGWFSLEAGAEATLPTSYSPSGTAGFEQHLALGSLAGCVAVQSLSACFVNKLGRVYVRGFGVDVPRDASGVVALTGARLALGREFSGTWLAALRLETLATVGSWDVTLSERTVWTTPLLSLSMGIDLALLFE